jgi:hypothetical protein
MTGNKVVSTMFEFDTCNHMDRFVLRDNGNEDPRYCHMDPGCDELFTSLY